MQRSAAVTLLIVMFSYPAAGAEKQGESRIRWVDLFKNGLAVVRRTVSIPEPGAYRVEDVPEPVHGTFWIQSDAKVTTRLTMRTVEAPVDRLSKADFQEALVGKEVVIHFSQSGIPPATGKVVAIGPAEGEEAWNRTYEQPRYAYYYYGSRSGPSQGGGLLVLETERGRAYVDTAMIAYLEAKGSTGPIQQRRPVLLLSVAEMKNKPATVEISYLAKGMAWAPSYRVDLSDPRLLSIEQKAVIKNELESFAGAEIRLISGFPSIQFAHVTSPLSLRTTWADFFTQLNQRFGPGDPSSSNILSQQAVIYNRPPPEQGIDLSAIPTGEGVDLHYQEIGRHTLAEGDSLAVDVALGKTPYETIVEWIVPDTRTAAGHYISDHDRERDPEKYDAAAWDAVRFKNPLPFPMTTGPAMIVCKGRFNGQRTSYWVNPGEESTLHITKALSIRTRSLEQEEAGKREELYVAGLRHWRTTVKGELWANNHRKETVTLVIRRRFSGDLLEADRSPKHTLLEEGVYSVNKRNELCWSIELKPGEEVKLAYRYTVLVRH